MCRNGKQDNIQMAVERILNAEVLLTIDEKNKA
jgi:hypothetical protein